jgi:hypothetical protein
VDQIVYLLAGLVAIVLVIELASRRRSRRTRGPNVYRVPHPDLDSEIVDLVKANRRIEAIKRYREENGVDLRTAKIAIEQLETQIRGQR